MSTSALFRTVSLALGLAMMLGCSGGKAYEGEQRFAIKGTVSFKGEPITSGMVSLIPEGEKGNPSGGPITNGAFSIEENRGPTKGRYRVAVYWHKPTGEKMKDPDTGEETDKVKQVIPAKYNDATELTADITGDPKTDVITLNLE